MSKRPNDNSEQIVVFTIIYSVLAFIGFAVFARNFDWLQIMVVPKVWLVEYAATLAR